MYLGYVSPQCSSLTKAFVTMSTVMGLLLVVNCLYMSGEVALMLEAEVTALKGKLEGTYL